MRDPHTIIVRPIITEKSTYANEANNAYSFKVSGDANKIEIKKAVEEIFDVKVKNVNTLWQQGKRKRVGRSHGTTQAYKKALVTLRPGHQIDLI